MPISLSRVGESVIIQKISGKDATKKHLENLGIVCGTSVRIISKVAGNLILDVKGTRIALDRLLAKSILI